MRIGSIIKHYPVIKVLADTSQQNAQSHISGLLLKAQYAIAERNESGEILDNINTRVCEYCLLHYPYSYLTIDHVNPRYFKGSNSPDNLKIVCERCNKAKGAIDPQAMPVTFSKLMNSLKKGEWPRRLAFLQEMKNEQLSYEENCLVDKLIKIESRALLFAKKQ